jgi:hypothetical protein
MHPSSFEKRHALAGAFFAFSSSLVLAATLRVPEDFDSIQRAILAAEPGDTVVIAPGTYSENLRLNETITVRGAGVGKTTIIAPERQRPIILVETGGTVTLTDLTLCHAPAIPDVKEPEVASFALEFRGAPVVLRNIRAEKAAAYILQSSANVLVAENLSLGSSASYSLSLAWTKPGTQISNLKIDSTDRGQQVVIENGAVAFKNLDPGLSGNAEILVSGPLSDVKFGNLSSSVLEKVRWSDASPDGPIADKIGEYEKVTLEEAKENAVALNEYRDQIRAKEPARRRLLRDYQNKLRLAKKPDDAVAALAAFLPSLYSTILDPETGVHDENLETIIRVELRALFERFGLEGLTRALELPHSDKNTLASYSNNYLSFDLLESLEQLKSEQWLKTNVPDLPALLAGWKKAPASDSAKAADAFLGMIKTISAKSPADDVRVQTALRKLAMAELPEFIKRSNLATLDAVVHGLTQATGSLIDGNQFNQALTSDQKAALIRHWKSAR